MVQRVSSGRPIIGLCGGIGAGKTWVARELQQQGARVIDSDAIGREVLARPDVLAELKRWWGDAVVTADGSPDRRRIAEIAFGDAACRKRLEGLIHPLIARQRAAMILEVQNNPAVTAIVIDSPLLLESNLDRECDAVVFVDAGEPRRVARLRAERGWTVEDVRRRERWQLPVVEKRSRADFVVKNDGPGETLGSQVAEILHAIRTRHS